MSVFQVTNTGVRSRRNKTEQSHTEIGNGMVAMKSILDGMHSI